MPSFLAFVRFAADTIYASLYESSGVVGPPRDMYSTLRLTMQEKNRATILYQPWQEDGDSDSEGQNQDEEGSESSQIEAGEYDLSATDLTDQSAKGPYARHAHMDLKRISSAPPAYGGMKILRPVMVQVDNVSSAQIISPKVMANAVFGLQPNVHV